MNKKRKSIIVQTRVDEPLYKLICRMSGKRDMSLSNFIRTALEETCHIKKKPTAFQENKEISA